MPAKESQAESASLEKLVRRRSDMPCLWVRPSICKKVRALSKMTAYCCRGRPRFTRDSRLAGLRIYLDELPSADRHPSNKMVSISPRRQRRVSTAVECMHVRGCSQMNGYRCEHLVPISRLPVGDCQGACFTRSMQAMLFAQSSLKVRPVFREHAGRP